MNQITTKQPLHNRKGLLANPGYAFHSYYTYDKKVVRKKNKLKEWDFYQILFDDKVLQLTIGHVSYMASVSATVFDLRTGKRHSVSKTMPCAKRFKKNMPLCPETAHVLQYFGKNLHVQFEVTDKYRRLSFSHTRKGLLTSAVDVLLTNSKFSKDKMVIATPFKNKRQWYYNYKECCFVANGYCQIEGNYYTITNGNGLLDWGRGVWPYKHQWVWGNGSTVVDGKHFGFNVGWGFGNTSNATENMFFYDNKGYKLGDVKQTMRNGKHYFTDDKRKFVFEMTPIYDNFTRTKTLWVNNKCHQLFGTWSGHVILDDGTKVTIPPFTAFCEDAHNKW